MGSWATGVTIVTSVGPQGPHGMTANAFLSVSLEPPLVLVSIGHESSSHDLILASRRFAVTLLAHDQEDLSLRFAQRLKDPASAFAGISWRPSPGGLPWLAGGMGFLECDVHQTFEAQDHTLVVGRVTALESGADAAPLVYFRSRYGTFQG